MGHDSTTTLRLVPFLVDLLLLIQTIESDDPFDMARSQSKANPKPTPASSQKMQDIPHRRVHSSLARLGTIAKNPPIRPTGSRAAGMATATSTSKMQPPKNASAVAKPSSNPIATKAIKSTSVVQRGTVKSKEVPKTTAVLPLQSGTTSGAPSQLRPHTSMSINLKTKTTSLPSRTTISSRARSNTKILPKQNPIFKHQIHETEQLVGVENFMFNV